MSDTLEGTNDENMIRALTSLRQMRARLESIEAERSEPIAIIGMACRFPGANTPDEYWDLLRTGSDAIEPTPADRWDAESMYDPNVDTRGGVTTKWGGFLDDIDQFDAGFFGISRREAELMDPQQRLFLEISWEALEHAGQNIDALAGTQTGVFLGIHSLSTEYFMLQARERAGIDTYSGTGGSHSVASGRLSYLLDLRGPSISIDTACSSSLVATHMAVQSLRSGETSMALAGGVNLMVDPTFTVVASRMGMMSPTGRCHTFDAAGDGFVRSDGCATLVLKRLSDAQANGDRVLAVIHGSAANQDGRSNGLTAPSSGSQEAVIRAALASANKTPSDVGLIETHGTGTPLGDPIEIEALTSVFAGAGSIRLGSAKANIGHTESAAGLAGLIKAVLSIRAGQVPPLALFDEPNPHLKLDTTPFTVPTALEPWDTGDGQTRIAGVSSFGWSGTNAHVIVGEAPAPETNHTAPTSLVGPHILPISARGTEARNALAAEYCAQLADLAEEEVATFSTLAATRRATHPDRLAAVGRTKADLIEALRAHEQNTDHPSLHVGSAPSTSGLVAFVFPGQGSQWEEMGRDLLKTDDRFGSVIESCEVAFAAHVTWSLSEMIRSGRSGDHHIDDIDVIQPVLFAISIAVAALWRANGVEPDAVVGHSMGEVAAAYIAGALTLDDAATVICTRSSLLRRIRGAGAMALVDLGPEEVEDYLIPHAGKLSIAVSNSRTNTVISGETTAVDTLLASLEQEDVFCRRINVDVASHSPQVDELLDDMVNGLSELSPRPSLIPLVSSVTATGQPGERLDARYWADNMREPVRFADSVAELIRQGHTHFIEVSPHPVLLVPITEALDAHDVSGSTTPSLIRDAPGPMSMVNALGQFYASGGSIDWRARSGPTSHDVELPTYPWQRERYWLPENVLSVLPSEVSGDHPIDVPDEWLNSVTWRSFDFDTTSSSAVPFTNWIVLSNGEPPTEAIVRQIEATGSTVQSTAGTTDVATISAEVARLTAAAGILVLVPPTTAGEGQGIVDQVEAGIDIVDNVRSIVDIAQQSATPLKVWLVTQDTHTVDPTDSGVGALNGLLWGFGRVVAEEAPEVWGGIIDVSADAMANRSLSTLTSTLCSAQLQGSAERELAIRNDVIFVSRLAPTPSPNLSPHRFRRDETVLITGGFGAVGSQVARSLVASGTRRLVLVGRTAVPDRITWDTLEPESPEQHRAALVSELEHLGAAVHTATLDVSDPDAVNHFATEYGQQGWPKITTVIHAAAVLGGELLGDLNSSHLYAQIVPKVGGALALEAAFPELERFVLFSSISGVLPMAGTAAYAAANAALDAIAHRRQAANLPGLSIAWGVWDTRTEPSASEADQGRTDDADPDYKDEAALLYEQYGVTGFRGEYGLAVLGRLLEEAPPSILFSPIDWKQFGEARRGRPLALVEDHVDAAHTESDFVDPLAAVHDAGPGRKHDAAEELVRSILAAVIKTDPGHIDPTQSFGSMGFDSMMGIELRNKIESTFGLQISATVAWNYPTTSELAAHLLSKLGLDDGSENSESDPQQQPHADTSSVQGTEPAVLASIGQDVSALTDDEALAALLNKGGTARDPR